MERPIWEKWNMSKNDYINREISEHEKHGYTVQPFTGNENGDTFFMIIDGAYSWKGSYRSVQVMDKNWKHITSFPLKYNKKIFNYIDDVELKKTAIQKIKELGD
jgi:hypothetical protein